MVFADTPARSSLAAISDSIAHFKWQPGVTPLSSPHVVLAFAAGYPVTAIFLSWILSKTRSSPFPLGYIPAAHNAVLCAGSLIMFLGTIHAVLLDTGSLYQVLTRPRPSEYTNDGCPMPKLVLQLLVLNSSL